jgi:hypothetical protein
VEWADLGEGDERIVKFLFLVQEVQKVEEEFSKLPLAVGQQAEYPGWVSRELNLIG